MAINRKQPIGFIIKVTTPSYIYMYIYIYIYILSIYDSFAFELIHPSSVRIASLIIPVCRTIFWIAFKSMMNITLH
jgi:hypothetical protein